MYPQRAIPWIVSLTFFMEAVDSTVINTAIPSMAASLAVDPVDLKVALISYLLSLAIFIPVSGWFADRYGPRRVMMVAVMVFTASSWWCGYSDTLAELMVARFVQGLGGALGLPVGRLLIVRVFGRERLISVMSHVIMVGALGIMLGPVIGGFITHYVSWSWIFWVNIPFGLFTLFLAWRYIPRLDPEPVEPLDIAGFLLFGLGLALMTLSFSMLSESRIDMRIATALLVIAGLCFTGYVMHSRHRTNQVVNTHLFEYRTFRVSVVSSLLTRLGFGGVPFLLPMLLQTGFGYPAQWAGILMAPTALGIVLAKPASLPLLRKLGYRQLLAVNTVLAGITIMLFAAVGSGTPFILIGLLTMMYGFFASLQYTAMNSLAYAEVIPRWMSSATSIMSTLQQLAQSFGVAFAAMCIRFFAADYHHENTLTPVVFHHAFVAMGLLTVASSLLYTRLGKEDGQFMIQ